MIKLTDFIQIENPEKTKVKFNMKDGATGINAWDYLLSDDPKWIEMNAYRIKGKPSFDLDKAEYLLAFAQYYPYGPEYYIFGGMYRVEKINPEVNNGVGYNLTLMPNYIEYRKRLIIRLKKPIGRDIYTRLYENLNKLDPEVYEIAPGTKLGNFPGYSNVLLTHRDLQSIYNSQEPGWKNALSDVKGVYCITDISTGQLYIGSAYGKGGIWQRWSSYANVQNLTGGNKAFVDLKNQGANYIIDNFTYSILEIFDTKTKDAEIIERESYWKRVFQSIKHGMNNN